MATAEDVSRELQGTSGGPGHHDLVIYRGWPSQLTIRALQSKAHAAAHEATLPLSGRALDHEAIQKFLADPNRKDTVLGHATNAASLARVNHLILVRLAEELNVNIMDIR
jgi:hypothetical protein